MTTCPSGVDYMHLIDHARAHIADKGARGFKDRALRRLLAFIVPYPARFRWALKVVPLARPLTGLMRRAGLKELAAMVELAPKTFLPPSPKYEGPGTAVTNAERRARVILLAGCVQEVLRSDINDATIRLLARRGVDVVVANGAGCCGALVHHLGREADARHQARRNVDAWSKEMGRGQVDAIIVNAAGCGTTIPPMPSVPPRSPASPATSPSSLPNSSSGLRTAGRRYASPTTRRARCSTASASTTSRGRS
jgi:glycolate oxidase iron-sulfur subunit